MNTDQATRLANLHDRHGEHSLTAITILLLVMLFVIAPIHAAGFIASVPVGGLIALIILGCVLIVSRNRLAFAVLLGGFVASVAAVVLPAIRGPSIADVYVMAGTWFVIAVTLAWVVARPVFGPGRITYHRIVGAVLLYLLIALIFTTLYVLAELINPNAISGVQLHDDPAFYSSLIYFSFVTLTSTGYGDILPVHPVVRALCNLETIIGQLYPATLLARLVSLEITSRTAE